MPTKSDQFAAEESSATRTSVAFDLGHVGQELGFAGWSPYLVASEDTGE